QILGMDSERSMHCYWKILTVSSMTEKTIPYAIELNGVLQELSFSSVVLGK
ncbi:MAG: hypothetical protein EZS28_039431, partial [Streblomastix strix]